MPVKFQRLSLALLVTLSLAACSGQKDQAAPAASADKPSVSKALSPQAQKKAVEAAEAASLPQPDASTPESSYVPLTSGHQLMFLYVANSKEDVDYNRMTEVLSGHPSGFADKFLERDTRAEWRPKIDDGIATAKAHSYVSLTLPSPMVLARQNAKAAVLHYDMDRKGFPLKSTFLDGESTDFNDNGGFEILVTNGAQFEFMPVADETMARRIESFNGYYAAQPSLKVFAFVQSTHHRSYWSTMRELREIGTVKAKIVKVQLIDSQGQVLVEQLAKD